MCCAHRQISYPLASEQAEQGEKRQQEAKLLVFGIGMSHNIVETDDPKVAPSHSPAFEEVQNKERKK